jgi:asparagine synthase (glutamine-hydrolysing)
MCGIIGFSGSFEKNLLEMSLARLQHRGPDDQGIFFSEHKNIGLAHARLSILDLSSAGHQPMTSKDGTIVIVFNGEIYNHKELRNELEVSGFTFTGNSDTEVLLNLYISEGTSMLSKLNGIFAFAIWDQRSLNLFIARDTFGVKPLYYISTSIGFAFSSELKSLIPFLPSSRKLDEFALQKYLTFLWAPGDNTLLKGVKKLGPGMSLTIKNGKILNKSKWFSLPTRNSNEHVLSKKEYIDGTFDNLRNAVHRQLISDVPVGAFLSGGLDSSSIVSFAREVNPQIRCFSIEMDGGHDAGDQADLPYARKVAKYLNVPLDIVHIDSKGLASDLEQMIYQLDEPLADPAPLNVLYISRLARENGIKVLLSGAGGDDIFSGYRRHLASRTDQLFGLIPKPFRKALEKGGHYLNKTGSFQRRISKYLNGISLDTDKRLINYFHWSSPGEMIQLFNKDFSSILYANDPDLEMMEFLAELPSSLHPIERLLLLEQRFFLTDHNLVYTDKMSMAVGVEVRVPFLDNDLVTFASKIPWYYKQHGKESKWILKRAMESKLPKEVIYRKKTGFGAPLRRWIHFEFKEMIDEYLSPASIQSRGIFDPVKIRKLLIDNDNGRIDASYTIFSLLCIEIWCRKFIDT